MNITRIDTFNLVISSLQETVTKSLPERSKRIVMLACFAFGCIAALYFYCKKSNGCFKQKTPADTQNDGNKDTNTVPLKKDEPTEIKVSATENGDHPSQEKGEGNTISTVETAEAIPGRHSTDNKDIVQTPNVTPPLPGEVKINSVQPALNEPSIDLTTCAEALKLQEQQCEDSEKSYLQNLRSYAQALSVGGKIDEAEIQFLKILKVYSDDVPSLVAYGELLYNKKDFVNAQTQFKKALELSPKDPRILHGHAQSLVGQRKFEEAEKEFAAALIICPNDSQLLNSYFSELKVHGILLQAILNYPLAEQKLQKAIEIKPEDILGLRCYADILKIQGKLEDALKLLKKALSLDRQNPSTLRAYGLIFQSLNQYDKAEKYLKEAVMIDPEHIEGLKAYGSILFIQGKLEEAEKQFEKALKDEDKDIFNLNKYGEILHLLEKYDQAAKQFQRALDLKPENAAGSWKGLGLAQFALKNYSAAEFSLEQSLKIVTDDVICLKAYGEVLNYQGKHQQAIAQLLKVILKCPDNELIKREIVIAQQGLRV